MGFTQFVVASEVHAEIFPEIFLGMSPRITCKILCKKFPKKSIGMNPDEILLESSPRLGYWRGISEEILKHLRKQLWE